MILSTTLPACTFEAAPESSRDYERSSFGRWADADGDCRNTRHELLADLSTGPVMTTDSRCRIIRGRWYDPYSGRLETEAADLDVDHVVPLAWAWEHGASGWSEERRRRFANDPANLVPTEAGINRGKGAEGPDEWLPPYQPYRCAYVLRFARIIRTYDLELTPGEEREIGGIRRQVCN